MSNATSQPASQRLYSGAHTVAGKVVIGAVGAVGAVTMRGVSSIVRNSAGNYTVNLADAWYAIAGFTVGMLSTTAGGVDMQLASEDVDNATTPNVVVLCTAQATGTPTDPPAGTMFLSLDLSNSSLGIG